MYLNTKGGRECCWPYLIDQHLFSPLLRLKRVVVPDYCYFAQVPTHFWSFYVPFRWAIRTDQHGPQERFRFLFKPIAPVNTGVLSFLYYVQDIALVALVDPPQNLNPNALSFPLILPYLSRFHTQKIPSELFANNVEIHFYLISTTELLLVSMYRSTPPMAW